MLIINLHRKTARPVLAALATSWVSQAALVLVATSVTNQPAYANCGAGQASGGGFGPPSISTAESSATQVLEEIRRRQNQAQVAMVSTTGGAVAQAPEPAPEPATTTPPAKKAPQAAEPAPTAPAEKKEAAPKEAPKEAAPGAKEATKEGEKAPTTIEKQAAPEEAKKVTPPPAEEAYEPYTPQRATYGSRQVTSYNNGQRLVHGVWAQGFLDWERHTDLAPGQEENPTRLSNTGGGVMGMDWTFNKRGYVPEAVQLGVFTGFNKTFSAFSATQFIENNTNTATADLTQRSDSQQEIGGPFLGAYMAYFKGKFAADLAFKADIFTISQSSNLEIIAQNGTPCNGAGDTGTQNGNSSMNDYILAGNVTYRMPHGRYNWWEPTAGFRFTVTDFGSDTSFITFNGAGPQPNGTLGLDDGTALRLQAGVRFGDNWRGPNGSLIVTTVGAFLYSDVLITGFTFTSTSGGLVTPVDEGKLRALGEFTTKLATRDGMSYFLLTQVRGGEDLFGVGGQLGIRYEW